MLSARRVPRPTRTDHLKDAKSCCNKAALAASDDWVTALTWWVYSPPCAVMIGTNQWQPSSGRRLEALNSTELEDELVNMHGFVEGSGELAAAVRHLTEFDFTANKPYPKNTWEGFGLRPGIPIMCILIICGICVGFLKLMEKIPKVILFGVFFAEFVFAIYLAIESKAELFWAIAAAIALYVGFMKKKIEKAAVVVSHAANALLNMPSLMLCVFSWLIVSCVLVVVLILVCVAAGQVSEIVQGDQTVSDSVGSETKILTCDFEAKDYAGNLMFISFYIWQWMWMYANAVQIFFVAGCVGTYHFHKDTVTPKLPLTFIKFGFTTSIGTLSKLSLVFMAVDYIKKKSRITCKRMFCYCAWADPITLIALVIRCCCLAFLNMMTKFCLIFHVFTGEPFWQSAKRTKELLEKAGLDGLVLETALLNCFTVIGYFFSVGMGFFCWWWMGVEHNNDILGDPESACSSCEMMGWLKQFMIILLFLAMYVPAYSIMLVVIVATLAGNAVWRVWVPWLCGVFVGSIASFFFAQTVQALLYAANTMFVAIAIDKAHGVTDDGSNPLYAEVVNEIQEAKVIAEKEAEKNKK